MAWDAGTNENDPPKEKGLNDGLTSLLYYYVTIVKLWGLEMQEGVNDWNPITSSAPRASGTKLLSYRFDAWVLHVHSVPRVRILVKNSLKFHTTATQPPTAIRLKGWIETALLCWHSGPIQDPS
eukprot:1184268-Prorocentrum_minimum.AAC.4